MITSVGGEMTLSGYQEAALRTARGGDQPEELVTAIRALGLAGEAGEVADYLKKVIGHGHPFDRAKFIKELGDVLWYVATLADRYQIGLNEIGQANIEKLKARYPDGFKVEQSINRKEGDV